MGLTLALATHQLGLRPIVLDKRFAPSQHSKAIAIHARTLETLAMLGLDDTFIAAGQKITGVTMHADGKVLLKADLSETHSRYNFAIDLAQCETERLLLDALERVGITVHRETELIGLEQDKDGVKAHCRLAGDGVSTFTAPYLVGCDGAHSTVRHQLGLNFEGQTYPQAFCLADLHIGADLDQHQWHLYFDPEGLFLLFPLGNSRWRIIATRESAESSAPDLGFFQEAAERRGATGLQLQDPVWLSSFTINRRMVQHYRINRVFLAGDAAHVHSPAGGQGMNTGMQDAFNLAWKLAATLRDGAFDRLLDTYQTERHTIGERVLSLTDRMTKAGTLKHPAATRVRKWIVPLIGEFAFLRHHFLDTLGEVNTCYPTSVLADEYIHPAIGPRARKLFTKGPNAGCGAPEAIITRSQDGQPVHLSSLYCGGHWSVLVFLPATPKQATIEACRSLRDNLDSFTPLAIAMHLVGQRQIDDGLTHDLHVDYLDARDTARQAFGMGKEGGIYLIRPDGYVGFRTLPLCPDKVVTFLGTLYPQNH